MNRMVNSEPYDTRAAACRTIASQVGMSCVIGTDGWDLAIVDLAEQLLFDKIDIVSRPNRVASEITLYLDDLVKKP